MIKFKFISRGLSARELREWIDLEVDELPNPFTLKQVESGMFSKTVFKRLHSIKKDGAKIVLRKGHGYYIGIQVINKGRLKHEASELRGLGKKLKLFGKDNTIQDFLKTLKRVIELSKNRSILSEEIRNLSSDIHRWQDRYRWSK